MGKLRLYSKHTNLQTHFTRAFGS